MKKVLITGATGALGQAVIARMKTSGDDYQIFALSTKDRTTEDEQLRWLCCDVTDLEQLSLAFDWASPDLIIHLAAIYTDNLTDAYRTNVAPAAHLLQLVKQRELKTRVVLIGSAAEYGVVKPEENPIREDHALYPVSVYGLSKAWQTQLLGLYANLGVDVICARIFNLFGPNLSERLFAGRLQNQINSLKNDGQAQIKVGSLAATRDYLSTTEAATQLLRIIRDGIAGNVYHIASGKPITMREFMLEQLKLHELSPSLVQEAANNSNHSGYDIPIIFADMQKTNHLMDQE